VVLGKATILENGQGSEKTVTDTATKSSISRHKLRIFLAMVLDCSRVVWGHDEPFRYDGHYFVYRLFIRSDRISNRKLRSHFDMAYDRRFYPVNSLFRCHCVFFSLGQEKKCQNLVDPGLRFRHLCRLRWRQLRGFGFHRRRGFRPNGGVASSELTRFTGWSFTSQSSSFWEASSRPGLHF